VNQYRGPRPVDKHFFAGFVFLPQYNIQMPPPVLIALAKPTVAVSLGMDLPIFFPHQLQSQMAMLLQLLMDSIPVRLRPWLDRSAPDRLVPKKLSLQFFFAQSLGQRPTDPGRRCPFQILVDRA
jgi:hypothetical protein